MSYQYNHITVLEDNPYIDKQYKRIDRDTYFLILADIISARSHDSQTQHGCVIVKDDRIISTGFNGFPPGAPDNVIPNIRPHKYDFVNHAETNAIYAAAKLGISLNDSKIYITGHPCCNCIKALVSIGIKDWVVGDRDHAKTPKDEELSKFWINHYNIQITEKSLYDVWQTFYSMRKF